MSNLTKPLDRIASTKLGLLFLVLGLLWYLLAPDALAQQTAAGEAVQLDGWNLTIYNMITVIGGYFAWIGGYLLDVSISVFVANMAGAASYFGLTSMIKTLWTVIRDLFNLLFIFALIWIGFQTILGIGGANTKKWVANLVIAALMINFSLYIAQVIVDFTNVAAFEISKMMVTQTYSEPIFGIEIRDISGGFIAKTELQKFPTESLKSLNTLMGPGTGINGAFAALALGFMTLIMLLVAGFVFAAGAVILLTRFLALTFLMVFSPLMFIGLIFPNFNSAAKKWWGMFFNQALVGPVFIFMLYFSYMALSGLQTMADYTITNIVVYFIIVIGFICLSLIVAKRLGAIGAGHAVSMGSGVGKWARARATNTALYGPRWLARTGVGWSSGKAQDKFLAWQSKPESAQSRAGKFARSAVAVTNVDRSIISATDSGKKAKFGLATSYKDNKDYQKNRRVRITGQQAATSREEKIDAGILAIESNQNNVPLDAEVMKGLATSIKDLTDSQLTEDIKLDTLKKEAVAIHLSSKQIESLEKSGKYSDQEIAQIKSARSAGFKNVARGGYEEDGQTPLPNSALYQARSPEWLSQKGVDEIAKMPVEVFQANAMAPYLTPAMVEAKMKSGLSGKELEGIRDNINNQIFNAQVDPQLPANKSYIKQWENWANRSSFGARLGLNL